MTALLNKDLVLTQGSSFSQAITWETPPYIYKPIQSITKSAPVSIGCTAHGLTAGWRVAVVSVQGMWEINAANSPPKPKDFHDVTITDANTVTLNDVNSSDFTAYATGGYLQFYTPVDLTGYTARMAIKTGYGGTTILTLDTTLGGLTIDVTSKLITISITAVQTAAITQSRGVYDLEMVSSSGVVTKLLSGAVTIAKEVTV